MNHFKFEESYNEFSKNATTMKMFNWKNPKYIKTWGFSLHVIVLNINK